MEGELAVTTSSFAKDFIKLIDEVKDERDIMELWHIEFSLAQELFLLFKEVVYGDKGDGDEETSDDIESVSDSDETDESFDLDTDIELEQHKVKIKTQVESVQLGKDFDFVFVLKTGRIF